jgi:sodium/bile acid cotransporter 7
MKAFFQEHWFLLTLAAVIAGGMTTGLLGYAPVVQPVTGLLNPRWITACVLFLMAFSLNSDHLTAAFRAPGPVLLASLINFCFVPLAAWLLMPMQQTHDFRLGLMIAASVPCTTAAASVMTRKARGNDAVSLLATIATNMSCFVLTPLWLHWTADAEVNLPTGKLMLQLLEAVLTPTIAGQLLRQPAPLHAFAVRHKAAIGVAALILIEVMVVTAALSAGQALHRMPLGSSAAGAASGGTRALAGLSPGGVALVWGSCVLIHLSALSIGWWLARITGNARAEASAVAFAGSQKTLPIGIYVSGLFTARYPFVMFPMLLYHTSQLFLDTWLASRMAARLDRPATTPPVTEEQPPS